MPPKKKRGKYRPPVDGYVTEYRNKYTGKLMKASDYGYKAWPFGPKKHKG
jgi:hypothetical protein